jgi:7-carboxy-7-deazaguanine synthase
VKNYVVQEMFYSLQGEGARAGSANVFVRFAGCNLTCRRETEGFDCDTDFSSGMRMTAQQICDRIDELTNTQRGDLGVIFTGGEPTLQLDAELVSAVKAMGLYTALETNGLRPVAALRAAGLDWVSCSPKTAEHTLELEGANELRYVRAHMQALPKPRVLAEHYYVSPAFTDDEREFQRNLAWCVQLCKESATWKMSVQNHKLWRVR